MITVYTIAYNEEFMLPFFIEHYRVCFPGCKIVVYDNQSTDKTREFAQAEGCEVRTFHTNNTLCDRTYLDIKNHCWKDATTDWVLVCDVDEHLWVNAESLIWEQRRGTTIIQAEGYNMVGNDEPELPHPFAVDKGVRAPSYDKLYLFDRTKITDINYLVGCHKANPSGKVTYSTKAYQCRHYKYLNLPYMIKRHREFAKRMSPINRQHGWGGHYLYTPQEITKEFNQARAKAHVI